MTKRDMFYFSIAKSVSLLSDNKKSKKMGCVIVHKNSIISVGYNLHKTHPLQRKYDVYRPTMRFVYHYIHAETMAIIKSKMTDFTGCSIYIYRQLDNDQLGLARPCASCIEMLKDYKLTKIFYTTNDGYAMEDITL